MIDHSENPVDEKDLESGSLHYRIVVDPKTQKPLRYIVDAEGLRNGWAIQIPSHDPEGNTRWKSIPDLDELKEHLILGKQSPSGSYEGVLRDSKVRVSYVCGKDVETVPSYFRDAIAGKDPVTEILWIEIPKGWNELKVVKTISRREFLKQAAITAGALATLGGAALFMKLRAENQKNNYLLDLEKEENAQLLVDGNRNSAVQATAEAAQDKGWERLAEEGFPKVAIDTAVGVTVEFNSENKIMLQDSSGTIMFYRGFWVLVASGHAFLLDIDPQSNNYKINLLRKSIPNEERLSFSNNEFGIAAIYGNKVFNHVGSTDTFQDYSIVVFPDDKVGDRFKGFVEKENALRLEQIDFDNDREITTDRYFGIGFPGLTNYEPALIQNGATNLLEFSPKAYYSIAVDNALVVNNCSGAGVFAKKSNGVVVYIGPVVASSDGDPNYTDNAVVSRVARIGKRGFLDFINGAVNDYQRKQK